MRKAIAIVLLGGVVLAAQETRTPPLGPITISSPDRSLIATVAGTGQAGAATWRYRLEQEGANGRIELLGWSPLGIVRDDEAFSTLRLKGASPQRTVSERYELPYGKRRAVTSEASERVLHFVSPTGKPIDLVLRAANDGFAFRYRFPDRSATVHSVKDELSGFTIASGSRGWLLPHQQAGKWSPAYEDLFSEVEAGATSPNAAGWSYPALFRLPDAQHWLLITEADLDPTYCGTRLRAEAPGGTYRVRLPDAGEGLGTGAVEPSSTLPWSTPWRVVIAGDGLAPIVESTLVTDLSAPTTLTDQTWVHPGRASYGWWKDDDASKKEDVLDRFIDLAATMTWEYSLIDANWHLLPEGALERVVAVRDAEERGHHPLVQLGRPAQRRYRVGAARPAVRAREAAGRVRPHCRPRCKGRQG